MDTGISTALITGGNSGIGYESVKLFLEQGFRVITADIRTDKLKESFADEPLFEYSEVDLGDAEKREKFCRNISSRQDAIDVLINNAGYSIRGMLENTPLHDVYKLFEINVFAPILLTQACLPGMRKQRSGTIINISSIAGKFTFPGNGPYSAAKHAIEALTDALRHEVAPFGIRVVAVRPAFIATAFNQTAVAMSREIADSTMEKAYQAISQRATEMLGNLWQSVKPSEPKEIARMLYDITQSSAPRAAYSAGPMANEFLNKRAEFDDDEWLIYMNKITGLHGFVQ